MERTEEQTTHLKEWVRALRSGTYEQGTRVLRSGNDRYCCLGVACDLFGTWAAPSSVEDAWRPLQELGTPYQLHSKPLMQWFGPCERDGGWYAYARTLADLNDGSEQSNWHAEDFETIANAIAEEFDLEGDNA